MERPTIGSAPDTHRIIALQVTDGTLADPRLSEPQEPEKQQGWQLSYASLALDF